MGLEGEGGGSSRVEDIFLKYSPDVKCMMAPHQTESRVDVITEINVYTTKKRDDSSPLRLTTLSLICSSRRIHPGPVPMPKRY